MRRTVTLILATVAFAGIVTACGPAPTPTPAPPAPPAISTQCRTVRDLVGSYANDLDDLGRTNPAPTGDAVFGAYSRERLELFEAQIFDAMAACPALAGP